MSSDIRPEDIEAAIAAAEQRRRSRQGVAAEPTATASAGRRPVLPERAAPTGVIGSGGDSRERVRPSVAGSGVDDPDDSWLDQPARPNPGGRRYADLPENEVVWEDDSERRGLLLPFGIAAMALLIFGGILWWVYSSGGDEAGGPLPVIVAEDGPIKVKPAEEGGLEVPDQDKLIYDNLAEHGEETAKVEQILPGPEEPVTPPPLATTPGVAEPAPLSAIEEGAPDAPVGAAPFSSAPEPAPPAASTAAPEAPAAVEQAATPPPSAEPGATTPAQEAAAPAAETPEPAPVAPSPAAGGGWKIQLAAVKSDTGARQEWSRMQKAHSDLLGDMRLTVQRADLGDKGIFFRIQAGPLPDRTTAEDVCAELKAAKQACLVVKP